MATPKVPQNNLTRTYYSPNTNALEGWTGGQGTNYNPPPYYKAPKKSFTRAYYSPNTQAYELGWRGGYGVPTHGNVHYMKDAIAMTIAFAEANRVFIFNKSSIFCCFLFLFCFCNKMKVKAGTLVLTI